MNKPANLRIAWLLTSAFYYWHPMLSCLTRLFPNTVAVAANWRGYAPGFENSFAVEVVGERTVVSLEKSATSYGSNFTYLPLNVVPFLLRFKPDVIFSNAFGMWTLLALMFKFLGQWRVVLAYEGSSPSVDFRNSPARLALRRFMVKTADACITNSQAGKQYLTEVLNADPKKTFLHPYEVPSAKAMLAPTGENQPAPLSYQQPVFLFIGSVTPRKGLHLLLNACLELKQRGQTDYSVMIIGSGSTQPALEAFCQEHGLTECIQWVGQVPYGDLGFYLQQADVFVLPTVEDTWGMVVLEAMAAGKAIICSKFAGASELVVSGENGYLVNPHDAQELADRMAQFILEPTLSDRMGQASTQIMTQYTPEAAAAFLADVATQVT